ncbi:hypothetical protein A9G34_09360 [Gilliamella sp. Choc4-2]|uniref:YhcB family protein n=1 Tax=unclassified Gilliamella TaxID=2685620 RepID=UPI0004DCC0B0|nr:DUF1043 family protein [Gilliamella apicola]KFA58682.1 hypothetical protein GAPWKB11_1300 [Gilliamella apicola]OCG33000.1 hypothetical protein A9G33_01655 [Gilliamella apicola]OCG43152.1 hypothetical protein A9G34_09360 [Gilliamella apicola]OCG53354.1 hypothetical protein A9G36_02210 [Gilliamella apicola]OCG65050.1 hypothetical protein A9G48_00025 [Gilliamella apicola]
MDKDIVIYLIIGFAVGFIISFIIMNVISPKARKYASVKRELEQAQEELKTQKQIIAKHFSHSAEILDNMAKDFRRLYQHMAENSQQIIGNDNIPNIRIDSEPNADTQNNLVFEKQPKDYSETPPNLFKTNEK